jgi:PGF-pre-PGF domain-containing protein
VHTPGLVINFSFIGKRVLPGLLILTLLFAAIPVAGDVPDGSGIPVLLIVNSSPSGQTINRVPVSIDITPGSERSVPIPAPVWVIPAGPSPGGVLVSTAGHSIGPGDSLQAAIDAAADGDILYLDPGIHHDNGITVAKNITLRANASAGGSHGNTIIDAMGSNRIISVNGGHRLVIENLTLQNTTDSAIFSYEGILVVTSTTFSNCSAGFYSGAILSSSSTVEITDSTFSNCSGWYGGAISSFDSDLTVSASIFSNCPAYCGGAIYFHNGTVRVSGSVFSGCTGTNGGAITSFGSGTITIANSTFTGCSASFGGAIYTAYCTVTITSTTFTSCTAMYGGAISTQFDTSTFTSDTFTGCSATNYGGAIYSYRDSLIVVSNTFTRCSGELGGAVLSQSGTSTFTNSVFTGCSATNIGGAIFSYLNPLNVVSTMFTDCSASQGGGAIFSYYGTATVTSSTFNGCTAFNGGAINNNDLGILTVNSSSFSNCTANTGGAIISWDTAIIENNSVFTGCSAAGGGAFYNSGNTFTITSSTISDCSASYYGSLIYGNTVTMHFCRVYRDGSNAVDTGSGNADNNWWGTNSGPATGEVIGPTVASWLVLGATANPMSITRSETSAIQTNLTYNSNGNYQDPVNGHVPDGIPVAFTRISGSGSIRPLAGSVTSGANITTFTPAGEGTTTVSAMVDGETVSARVFVFPDWFTGTPESGPVPLTVRFTNQSMGSPTSWNWSFGDGQWFNTSDAAANNPSHTYTSTGTYTVKLMTQSDRAIRTITRPNYITVTAAPIFPDDSDSDVPVRSGGSGTSTPPGTDVTYGNKTVNVGGNSAVTRVMVSGTGISGLMVTGTTITNPGQSSTPPQGITYQYIDITPARYTTISGAVIFFTVPLSLLQGHNPDPHNVVLYHKTSDGWVALPTTVLSTKDGAVHFSASSPGLSLFAIGGVTETTEPVSATTARVTASSGSREPATQAPVIDAPVTKQTTTPPAVASMPSASSPVIIGVFVIAAMCMMGAGGCIVRRWWIRRQNPALFREYD